MNARSLLATAAAASIYACGSGAERQSAGVIAGTSSDTRQPRPASSPTMVTAAPEGCDLIPRGEIERIAARPLAGEPKRDGRGCWYYVAMDTVSAEWKQLRERAE